MSMYYRQIRFFSRKKTKKIITIFICKTCKGIIYLIVVPFYLFSQSNYYKTMGFLYFDNELAYIHILTIELNVK